MQSTTRTCLLLFLGCLLFHAAGIWIIPLIDRDEPRFAEASREMLEGQNFVVPYFNGAYRFDKPPLTYWAQCASYAAFGDNDFAARLPSCLAAALAAVVLFGWGRRMANDRVGVWAAVIFSLSLQTVEHAKAAVADMWLVLFVALAHWAGYELLRDVLVSEGERSETQVSRIVEQPKGGTHSGWWWLFYVSLALAFLAKGPVGWTPLLTVAAARVLLGKAGFARRFAFLRGILLTLLLVSLWGIPALRETHGEFLRVGIGRHVIGRSVSAIGGHGASSLLTYLVLFPFYFVTVFSSFFPWSLKLPSLFRGLRAKRDFTDTYLLCGTAIVFLIFTLVTTRLVHYTLPAFPLLALLLARFLCRDGPSQFLNRATRIALPVYLLVTLCLSPFVASFFPAHELFQQSRDSLRPEMEFGAVEFKEPSLVWYFRKRVRGFMTSLDDKSVEEFMSKSGPRFAILPTSSARAIFPALPPQWKSFSTRGYNLAKGKRSDLTLVIKPE